MARNVPAVEVEYQWTKLSSLRSFRLLHLHGYDNKGRITCSLTHTEIDNAPNYTAISHHWGDQKQSHTVLCDGKTLPVTAGVHTLFTHLLEANDDNRTIWIDTICINQKDLQERAQQVLLMKDIFSKASLTIVWLGEPEEPELVPAMLELGQKIIDMTKTVTPRRLKSEDFEACGLPPVEESCWKTLANFFCLPWFQRVWITQEYILANTIKFLYGTHWKPDEYYVLICGTLSSNNDSYYLEESLRPLVSRSKQVVSSFYSNQDPNRWWGISQRLSFLDSLRSMRKLNDDHQEWILRILLRRTSTSKTTNLRDHIYGVLGLLPEDVAKHPDLQPNYVLSHEVTYTKFARFVLETNGLATLLSSSGFPRFALTKPSWVPDWSQQKLPSVVHRKACQTYPSTYGDDKSAFWRLDDRDVPEKLFVRGIIFDTVSKIESMLARAQAQPAGSFHENRIKFILDTLLLMAESAHVKEPPAALALRHLRTLCQDNPPGLNYDDGYIRTDELENVSELVAPIYDLRNQKALIDDPELQRKIAQQWERIYVTDLSMGFCMTGGGEIGRIPHEAKEKDEICFFQGINIPFVIRGSEEGSNKYTLVGHCYIDGQMEGKYWQEHDSTEVREICLV